MTRLVYLFLLVFGLMAGAGLMAGTSIAAETEVMPSADPVFAATLADFDGKPVPLAELKGKLVVLNFWATWCGPCRMEIPHLIEAQEKYGPHGIVFIGAAVEDNADSVRDFGKAYGINYSLVMAGKDQVRIFGLSGAQLISTVAYNRQVDSIAFSPDGKRIATAGDAVNVWDWANESRTGAAGAPHVWGSQSHDADGRQSLDCFIRLIPNWLRASSCRWHGYCPCSQTFWMSGIEHAAYPEARIHRTIKDYEKNTTPNCGDRIDWRAGPELGTGGQRRGPWQ